MRLLQRALVFITNFNVCVRPSIVSVSSFSDIVGASPLTLCAPPPVSQVKKQPKIEYEPKNDKLLPPWKTRPWPTLTHFVAHSALQHFFSLAVGDERVGITYRYSILAFSPCQRHKCRYIWGTLSLCLLFLVCCQQIEPATRGKVRKISDLRECVISCYSNPTDHKEVWHEIQSCKKTNFVQY